MPSDTDILATLIWKWILLIIFIPIWIVLQVLNILKFWEIE